LKSKKYVSPFIFLLKAIRNLIPSVLDRESNNTSSIKDLALHDFSDMKKMINLNLKKKEKKTPKNGLL